MSQLFILVTDSVKSALSDTKFEVIQTFGQERIVDGRGEVVATGVVTLLDGTKEDFNKLLKATGEFWVNTNPTVDSWEQILVDKTGEEE